MINSGQHQDPTSTPTTQQQESLQQPASQVGILTKAAAAVDLLRLPINGPFQDYCWFKGPSQDHPNLPKTKSGLLKPQTLVPNTH